MNWLETIKSDRDNKRLLETEIPRLRDELRQKIWDVLGTKGFEEILRVSIISTWVTIKVTKGGSLILYEDNHNGDEDQAPGKDREYALLKALIASVSSGKR